MNERAFPLQSAAAHNGQYGMTLRDYFAAQALAGLSCPAGPSGIWPDLRDGQMIAERAYAFADAMLAERAK